MPNATPWYKRSLFRWVLLAIVLVAVGTGLALVFIRTQAAPVQPIPYNHAAHIGKGISCQYCHSGAYRNQSAGLPTRDKCLGCHANMDASTPGLKAVSDYLNKNEKIEWVPVAILPDFIYFSHQPHVAAGLNCETCHGDVGKMAAAQPNRAMNMGWCLDCHKKLAHEKFAKLSDCSTCHQ